MTGRETSPGGPMADKNHTLILGGTAEAVALANAVTGAGNHAVTYSLAGRTGTPRLPVSAAVRTGGFGGADALAAWMDAERISAVIDATHPFAGQIARNAAAACEAVGVPRLKLLRPAWTAVAGDDWTETDSIGSAAGLLAPDGGTVFLSIGRQELAAFTNHRRRRFLIRTVDEIGQPPLADAVCLTGRGPFTLAEETGLLRRHGVETLITKNAGGEATYAKIAAARAMKIPVVMVARPSPPPGPCVGTVEAAARWLKDMDRQDKTDG